MSVEIRWLGHASFRIAGDNTVVYIDPWKLQGQPHDADVVVVSHSHYDHCSADDVQAVSKNDTTVIAPADAAGQLGVGQTVSPAEGLTVAGVTVEAVAAYNVGKSFHPKGNGWIGAVVTIDGKRIYYAGDTDLIEEMSDLRDIDLALLPVGGTYTMDAAEAAEACRRIGCAAALPYHWGDIVGDTSDAQALADAADCTVHVLQPGQSLTL